MNEKIHKAGQKALAEKYGPDWGKIITQRGRDRQHELAQLDPLYRSNRGYKAAETARKKYGHDYFKKRPLTAGFIKQKGKIDPAEGLAALIKKYGPDWAKVTGAKGQAGKIKKYGEDGAARQARRMMKKARAAITPELQSALGKANSAQVLRERGREHFVQIGKRGGLRRVLKFWCTEEGVSIDLAEAVVQAVSYRYARSFEGVQAALEAVEVNEYSRRQVERALKLLVKARQIERTPSTEDLPHGGYIRRMSRSDRERIRARQKSQRQ